METYFITAKTVEEAYAEANRKYADENHEVSCEVVEMPKKGFLGLGSKDAKIKVTVTSSGASELSSLVNDMRGMKKYTDRGADQKKNENKQNTNTNNKQKQGGNRDNKNDNTQKNDRNQQNRPQNQNQNKNQNQNQGKNQGKNQSQNQNKNQPQKKEEKPVQAKENNQVKQAQAPKSSLHNQAKQNVRTQIKHKDSDVSGSSVTVSSPMGLTDFVPENKNTFGNTEHKGGSMNNDIRKKKPQQKKLESAEKIDEKIRTSKYDMAESDDDYKNIETMVKESETLLDDEANSSLGLVSETVAAEEPRKREPVTQAEMDYALDFANTLLKNMNLEAHAVQCECPEGEEFEPAGEANVYPKIEIIGDDTGILIGHHGETLDAIQYLVNLSSLRKTKSKDGDYVKIVVDIENYRDKRAATLKALARRMAAKAVKYKRNVFLEPMNAYERRIIHSELQNVPDVSTHSVGTDRDRKIIITYEGEGKQNNKGGKNGSQSNGNGRSRRRRGSKNNHHEKTETVSPELIQALNEEHRHPKKIQKVPIENLSDVLEGNGIFSDSTDSE